MLSATGRLLLHLVLDLSDFVNYHHGSFGHPYSYAHGDCDTSGSCTCDKGWAGSKCDSCAPDYFGPQCLALPAIYSLFPGRGSVRGGNNVTLTGANFVNTSAQCRYVC